MPVVAMFGTASFLSESAIVQKAKYSHHQTSQTIFVPDNRPIAERLYEHKFMVVSAVVGGAVLGAGVMALRNRNIGGAQKFMNIRLYGQMAGLLAVGVLMGLAAARPDAKGNGPA